MVTQKPVHGSMILIAKHLESAQMHGWQYITPWKTYSAITSSKLLIHATTWKILQGLPSSSKGYVLYNAIYIPFLK